ncbi:hypothetical protein D3C73_1062530 [compost metagenome]
MDRTTARCPRGAVAAGGASAGAFTPAVRAEIALRDGLQQVRQLIQRKAHEFADVHACEGDRERLRLQALSVTGRAQLAFHVAGNPLAHQRALGIGKRVQYVAPGAGIRAHVAGLQLALERGTGLGRCEAGIDRHGRRLLGEQDPLPVLLR